MTPAEQVLVWFALGCAGVAAFMLLHRNVRWIGPALIAAYRAGRAGGRPAGYQAFLDAFDAEARRRRERGW